MKKLLTGIGIFILFITSANAQSQWPINQTFGSSTSRTLTRGIHAVDSAFQYRYSFPDTATVNLGRIDELPGVEVLVGDTIWIRNSTATAWLNTMRGGGTAAGSFWSLTGNAGIDEATNFLGTTDDKDLIFRVSNDQAGRIGVYNVLGGGQDIAFGTGALGANNFAGNNNIAIGRNALTLATSSSRNIAIGSFVGSSSITAGGSTMIGFESGKDMTSLSRVTSLGHGTFRSTTTSSGDAIGIGYEAATNSNPYRLIAIGRNAADSNDGNNNIVMGAYTLTRNGFYSRNIAIGDSVLMVSTADDNVGIGWHTLSSNTIGTLNVAVGPRAMEANTTGGFNTAVGYRALTNNTTGAVNTAFGGNALLSNTTGEKNDAFGGGALENNTTGGFNSAFGQDALLNNTTGIRNIGIGWNGYSENVDGNENIGIGYDAGGEMTGGDRNTVIGFNAGNNVSQREAAEDVVLLGANTFSTEDSVVVLGATYIKKTYLQGEQILSNYGSGTYTGTPAYSLSVDASGNVIETAAGGSQDLQSVTDIGSTTTNDMTFDFTGSSAVYIFDDASNPNILITGGPPNNLSLHYNEIVFENASGLKTISRGTGGSMTIFLPPSAGTIALNPMTTAGDIVVGGASGVEQRLGIGTANQQLRVNSGGTALEYFTPSGGSAAWNGITNPTGDQSLTFDAGEVTTWANSNTTEDLFTVNTSTLTTASLFSLNSTSTALGSGNNLMELVMSGANGSSSITATGLRISITNTGTSSVNAGLDITASGASTNYAARFNRGRVSFGTAGTESGLLEINGSTSGTITLQPAAAAGTYTLTLPTDDGDAGEFLQTDGSGNLTWAAGGSGSPGGSNTQVQYNNSGSFGGITGATTDGTTLTLTSGRATTDFSPTSSDGATLGTTSLQFSDLFLASGAVVNFSNGGYTITHSSAQLLFASGTGTLTDLRIESPDAGDFIEFRVANDASHIIDNNGTIDWRRSNTRFAIWSPTLFEFNSQAANVDFKIESDNQTNMFYLDASADGIGIKTNAPTALMHFAAGTATAGTAPLKLTAGTNLTAEEAGAIEFDGTDLFYTTSTPTRRTVANLAAAQTFTNKRITKRVGTTASSTSLTIDSDSYDVYTVTALAGNITINAPSGTPTEGQELTIRIEDDGTSRTVTYNAAFRACLSGTALISATTIGKEFYTKCIWNSSDSVWDIVAQTEEN